jgi:hypothetical protein
LRSQSRRQRQLRQKRRRRPHLLRLLLLPLPLPLPLPQQTTTTMKMKMKMMASAASAQGQQRPPPPPPSARFSEHTARGAPSRSSPPRPRQRLERWQAATKMQAHAAMMCSSQRAEIGLPVRRRRRRRRRRRAERLSAEGPPDLPTAISPPFLRFGGRYLHQHADRVVRCRNTSHLRPP